MASIPYALLPALLLAMPFVLDLACGQQDTSTSGFGGKHCGKFTCLCDDNVTCSAKKCKCDDPFDKGDGLLVCAEKDEHLCYIVNDPVLRAFTGEAVNLPVSCKFSLTVLKVKVKNDSGDIIGECIIQSHAWGSKGKGSGRKGKHFTGGMEIVIRVMLDDNDRYYHATRIAGQANNGLYNFREWGNDQFMAAGPWGDPVETIIDGERAIYTEYDEKNNIAEVVADYCNVRMGFRPAECLRTRSDADLSPGVYMKVKDDCTTFVTSNGLCFAPGQTIDDYVEALAAEHGKNVSRRTAMMFRILKGSTNQDFPGAPESMQALAVVAQQCHPTKLLCALDNCLFITEAAKFTKCWDKEFGKGQDVSLMQECFESICDNSVRMCEDVQDKILDSSCVNKVPTADPDNIIAMNCTELDLGAPPP